MTKHTFQWFIEDVGPHIVEGLGRDERVDHSSAIAQSTSFTTGSTEILVVIECLPQVEQSSPVGLCTCIEKDDHLRIQHARETVEQPAVRVYFVAGLLL